MKNLMSCAKVSIMADNSVEKHVILIGVDSLRSDVFEELLSSKLKHVLETGPFANGMLVTECYTHSGPTQMANPSVISGGLPLDDGGYANGVLSRAETLAEFFKKKGYVTFGTAANPYFDQSFGYNRGFDRWIETFNVFAIWRTGYIVIQDALRLGKLDTAVQECWKRINALQVAVKYRRAQGITFASTNIVSLKAAETIAENERRRFLDDEGQYVESARTESEELEDYWKDRNLRELYAHPLMKLLCMPMFPKRKRITLRSLLFRLNSGTEETLRAYKEFRGSVQRGASTFAFLYFNEVHDNLWFPFPAENNILCWFLYLIRVTHCEILRRLIRRQLIAQRKVYEKTVFYVMKRITECLNIFHNPHSKLYVLQYSDHGAPLDPTDGKMTCSFKRAYVRVPLLMNEEFKKIVGNITGALGLSDIPLILRAVEEPSRKHEFGNRHIILENTGRGLCDPKLKPISLAIVEDGIIKTYRYQDGKFDESEVPEIIRKRVCDIKAAFSNDFEHTKICTKVG